jgi:hypothetical protein
VPAAELVLGQRVPARKQAAHTRHRAPARTWLR